MAIIQTKTKRSLWLLKGVVFLHEVRWTAHAKVKGEPNKAGTGSRKSWLNFPLLFSPISLAREGIPAGVISANILTVVLLK